MFPVKPPLRLVAIPALLAYSTFPVVTASGLPFQVIVFFPIVSPFEELLSAVP
jgi:hypothetical protein